MDEPIMPFDGNGLPDILSINSSETEKVDPTKKVSPTPSIFQSPSLVLPDSLSTLQEQPESHLKASTFIDPTLPIDWLSQSVQDYIRTVTESYGCPQDYVVVICFITAGIAAGKMVQLATNPYTNYPCDFVCLVGKPSRNKTGPLKEVTSPLREHDKINFIKYLETKALYDQRKPEDKNLSGEQPIFHQRVVGDSTSESRNTLLAQGDMLVCIADELKSFIDSFGRYTKGGNGSAAELSQVLSIWSNVSFTINRKSEDTKLIDEPAMSIIGGIQPELLSKTFGIDALMDSGFTQRFLFVYPQKAEFIKRRNRIRMTRETRDIWSVKINKLINLESRILQLSKEAENIYFEYADANDLRAESEEDENIAGMIQKMNIHVLRLAIMGHLLCDHWDEPVITGGGMEYAIRVADYFTRIHIERIFPLLRDTRNITRTMTSGDLIRAVNRQFKIKSQNSLAEVLGVSQQYINKIINM